MQLSPDVESFRATYQQGRPQVVWTTLAADLETPVSAMLKLADGRRFSFLLDSVEGGAVRGRYSLIGLKPDLIWRCRGERAEINRHLLRGDEDSFEDDGPALDSLKRLIEESRIDLPDCLPAIAMGLVGYMGYDTIRLVERLPDDNPDPIDIPDAVFARPTVQAVFDNVKDTVTLVTPIRPRDDISAEAAWELAGERLAEVVADFERGLPYRRDTGRERHAATLTPAMAPADYQAMVERAKEYIRAGDIFQVVLSQRFSMPFRLPPLALYRALRRTNPAPFLFCLDFGDYALIGASPEILVRLRDGEVTVRPIAGTRKRGATTEEDEALAADLLADPKELAEHLMLLDLGRNDVGRVAEVGTVKVTDQMVIERYSQVMHIVSNVVGRLRPELDAMDALMAGFPAGTVSGAPKVRAMEIIEELEPLRRGFYAGGVGYIAANGDMDTCIALRTSLLKDGELHLQAGAGIVLDSDPVKEHEECENKARALVRAAEEALRTAGR
ncbi:anthranilate synthase component I [Roseospirillum parvum]|uniref:Anthranilate synthase component 1 n=1 Tax=Roseospirillum parvum TaxID=83401 RepID=A0A1G8B5I0_9PROT|nr:anthranilate synthase component I [Roseospirillum parvum]SDH28447.1 anthranilate synthase component 1 [Roseospirillum parvum]